MQRNYEDHEGFCEFVMALKSVLICAMLRVTEMLTEINLHHYYSVAV